MHHKPFGGRAYSAPPDPPAGLRRWAPGRGKGIGKGDAEGKGG